MTEAWLRIERLNAYRGHLHILHDVSIDVRGEPLAIIGRNGMGKTTLCESIMGLLRRNLSGSIEFMEHEVLGQPSYRIVAAGLGYVPQGRRLFPSLSVDEHLAIAERRQPGNAGWSRARIYDLFPALADKKKRAAGRLSGGEQQMLSISRALMNNPKMLVMDEPSEGLAPIMVNRMIDAMKPLVETGVGLFLVEQNLWVATELARRQAIMVNGVIVREVSADELRRDPELQQRYLGARGTSE